MRVWRGVGEDVRLREKYRVSRDVGYVGAGETAEEGR